MVMQVFRECMMDNSGLNNFPPNTCKKLHFIYLFLQKFFVVVNVYYYCNSCYELGTFGFEILPQLYLISDLWTHWHQQFCHYIHSSKVIACRVPLCL